MKPLEKLAVLALLTFAFCGCTRTSEVKAEEKIAVQEEVKARSTEQTAETVQTGPETITTTVEEFAPPKPMSLGSEPSAGSTLGIGLPGSGAGTRVGANRSSVPGSPLLVKRTVTVDQRGPVVATKTEAATMATTAFLTEKQEKASDTKKRTSYWPPWWLWAIGAVGVALGIAVLRKTLLGKAVAAAEAAAKEVL